MTTDEALTPDALERLVKRGRTAEFDWLMENAPDEIIRTTLAAMANARGGRIVAGITGEKQPEIIGVSSPRAAVDHLLGAALTLEPPLITPLPQVIELEGKQLVVLDIPAGMPHIYACDGRYLYREDARNATLQPRELRRLMFERGELSYEMEPTRGATIDDLNWEKVKEYARRLRVPEEESEQLLVRRGCLVRYNNRLQPTNAGILLFGKDPLLYMRGVEITAVRFAGETMGDTFSRQDITGTLPDQIRRAETFLIDHLRRGVKLKQTMTRQEQFEYPMEAAREVVVNAVAHRDYSIQGDGIRLFLFKDRMEVNSPGKLPGPVTVDNIKDERFSRNPTIVQVLSDMGFIERLGYGIDRMIDLMSQHDLREPQFSETGGGFRVKLYNTPLRPRLQDAPALMEERGSLKDFAHVPLNSRQEVALLALIEGGTSRITNSELQRMFPDVHAETIRRDLADLVTKDILAKMGQKRGSYYVLKRDADAEAEAEANVREDRSN
ncbi:MAG: ATP-binding protein [Chloroflexota bacterium]